MIIELFIAIAMIWAAGYLGYFLHKITLPGLISGKVQARGRHYTKSSEPLRFWFCIVFFVLMFLMMCFVSVIWTLHVWTRLNQYL